MEQVCSNAINASAPRPHIAYKASMAPHPPQTRTSYCVGLSHTGTPKRDAVQRALIALIIPRHNDCCAQLLLILVTHVAKKRCRRFDKGRSIELNAFGKRLPHKPARGMREKSG